MTEQLPKIQNDLSGFLTRHDSVLTEAAREALQGAIKTAENHQFDCLEVGQPDYLTGFLEDLAKIERVIWAICAVSLHAVQRL